MMLWKWVGQFVFSWAFVWIYFIGISRDIQWSQAFRYALAIICVAKVPGQMIMWATTPYPWELISKWFFISAIQAMLSAFVMTWTFKPSEIWSTKTAH